MRYSFCTVFVLAALVCWSAAEESELKVNGDRLNQRIAELARFGRNAEGGVDTILN